MQKHRGENFALMHDQQLLTCSKLYLCRHCPTNPPKFYLHKRTLTKHIDTKHSNSSTRSQTNTDIIVNSFRDSSPTTWQGALQWLNNLNLQPPQYRTNLWRKLDYTTQQEYFSTRHHLHQWIIQAMTPYQSQDPPPAPPNWDTTSDPLWKLLLIFDMLILSPRPKRSKWGANQLTKSRLYQFRLGLLQGLHNEAMGHTRPSVVPAQDPAAAAQLAANDDNYHTSYARLTKALPVATITPQVKQLIQKLYPPPTPYVSTFHNTRSTTYTVHLKVDQDILLRALKKLKKGTAAGPYCDLTDTLRSFALHQHKETDDYPYLPVFAQLLELILNNAIPSTLAAQFAANYFMALYKDPNDHTKLRPIGMGSALRRIAGKYIMEAFSHNFATLLLPVGQFGIAIKGGLDYMLHTARSNISRFIDLLVPTRVLLLLDIRNMFNSVSRVAIRDVLQTYPDLQPILPFFDLLYGQPTKCYYYDSNGNTSFFVQQEGVAQGCPLGPIFAALCLFKLLNTLLSDLKARAQARLQGNSPGDDDSGSIPITASYIDDTFAFLSPLDLPYFLHKFSQLGKSLGIVLNLSKTKIITSIDSQPIHTKEHPHKQIILQTLLDLYTTDRPGNPTDTPEQLQQQASNHHEITTGTRLLGAPIGAAAWANTFLASAAATYTTALNKLQQDLQDKHTALSLFRCCAQPSLFHLLSSDIYYNHSTTTAPELHNWNSPFTQTINNANSNFYTYLADQPHLHPLAHRILHHPSAKGGIGFRDVTLSAIPSYLISTTRTLRYATKGVSINDQTITLPPHLTSTFRDWSTSTSSFFTLYRHLLPSLITHYEQATNAPTPLTQPWFVSQAKLNNLSASSYAKATATALDKAKSEATPEQRLAFPSILTTYTSLPLAIYHRRNPHNRLSNDTITTTLQRKLRLPALPPTLANTNCRYCNKPLDPLGDHLFRCSYNKIVLHNTIRDTLYTICKQLAPMAQFTHSQHNVSRETPGLIPPQPNKRPADVGFQVRPTALSAQPPQPATFLAIDVTITTSPQLAPPGQPSASTDQSAPIITTMDKAHQNSIGTKLNGHDKKNDLFPAPAYINNLLTAGNILLPFTVDPHGALGRYSHLFLHGSKDAPKPPQGTPHFARPSPTLKQALATLEAAPTALLPKATQATTTAAPPNNQRLYTPTKWAQQTLALNITTALAKHLHTHIAGATRNTMNTTEHLLCRTQPFQGSAPPTVLHPYPHFLLATGHTD